VRVLGGFPVLYGEAREAYEEDELDDLSVDDPENDIGTETRTAELELTIVAEYDPASKQLRGFDLTSTELRAR